jgi:prepilin-type N-terminal cleavage/methylation domain-containing protein
MNKTTKSAGFTLIELLVVISIIAILAGIALPVFGEVKIRGDQTKALSNAKQIGTACKIFAVDYSGMYPHYTDYPLGTAATPTEARTGDNSNAVLGCLVPDYLPDKGIFIVPKSKYCLKAGAATQGQNTNPLGPGENHWAYVSGLNDTSNSRWPLLADGFDGPNSIKYTKDENLVGGQWKGKKAIVIRCDGSGTVENVMSTTLTVKRSEGDTKNAFEGDTQAPADGSTPWFSKENNPVLNPRL